jgi:hypothetical protein
MEWCWAADSEISNAYQKYQGDKAWIYKYPGSAERHDLQIGIVGAGDASFIQYAAERINGSFEELYERPRGHTTMPEASAIIQGILNDLHHNHLYPVPAAYEQPRVELILGLWLGNQRNRLAKTYLTAMTKIWEMSRPLLKFSGGSVDILRDVLH